MANETIQVPARALGQINLPNFCPRCYWVQLHYSNRFPFQIPMPGIFSAIDSYSKKIIHSFFDENRRLPDWFPDIGEVKGYVEKLSWQKFTFMDDRTNIRIVGTPDDIFKMGDDSYHILDYKTSKLTQTQDELYPLYEVQLNAYAIIAERIGFSPVSAVSLVYMEPQTDINSDEIGELGAHDVFSMKFKAMLKQVTLELGKVAQLLERTRQIYDNQAQPEPLKGCRNCELIEKFLSVAGHDNLGFKIGGSLPIR